MNVFCYIFFDNDFATVFPFVEGNICLCLRLSGIERKQMILEAATIFVFVLAAGFTGGDFDEQSLISKSRAHNHFCGLLY